jgi:methionyl-tRNA formyltransferase
MRVIFMGTPAFAVPSLEALLERGFDVAAVVTQPDRRVGRGGLMSSPPVKEAALRAGLTVLQPPTLRKADAVASLRELAPDVIVVVAFGQILRPTVLDLPPLGCINLHPSLLPKWRGASPIQAAIRAGETTTGISIMRMDERMDAGPILAQVKTEVYEDDTAATLGDRLARLGAVVLVDTLSRLATGTIEPIPQDETVATYCQPLKKEDADVDWSRSAEEIARACRAQTPWPGCQGYWRGRQVRLFGLSPRPDWRGTDRPGTIVPLPESRVGIATGRGAVEVHQLQLAGRKPLESAEFLRGQPGFVGAVLEPPPTRTTIE